MNIKQVLESTKKLSDSERAMLASCLISSLDSERDEGAESEWQRLAMQRFEELESGKVQGVSWAELKKDIKE